MNSKYCYSIHSILYIFVVQKVHCFPCKDMLFLHLFKMFINLTVHLKWVFMYRCRNCTKLWKNGMSYGHATKAISMEYCQMFQIRSYCDFSTAIIWCPGTCWLLKSSPVGAVLINRWWYLCTASLGFTSEPTVSSREYQVMNRAVLWEKSMEHMRSCSAAEPKAAGLISRKSSVQGSSNDPVIR